MLVTVCIYIIAVLATLNSFLLQLSLLITALFVFFIIKNIFPLKYVIIWALIFYFGVLNTSFRLKDSDELLSIAPVNCDLYGSVLTIPQNAKGDKTKFFFDVDKIIFNGIEKDLKDEKVIVTLSDEKSSNNVLKIYDSYKLQGRLSVPFKAGNPSQFDYGNYLRNYDTYAVFYAKDFIKIEKEPTKSQKFMQKINDYRENVIALHSKYIPSPYLEILGGIVFGDDAVSPTDDVKQSFVESGLLHILAASGMNVAFIYMFFYYITSLFRLNYRFKIILGMIMVVIYALMTGLGASIIRAAAMLLFVLAGKLIDRDAHSISLLSFVAFLMLLYNPMYINVVGFQLSFIVTLGILLMSPLVVSFNNKWKDFIVGTISIPIIAQMWVIPIQIYYFNSVSIYSIFANIMSVPILSVISFGGFVSSLLVSVRPLADKICEIFDFVLEPFLMLLVKISELWANLPNSTIHTTQPNLFQIVLYYLILLFIISLFYKDIREKYLKVILKTLLVAFVLLLLTFIPIRNSNLEITVFDVGNADSFLIKTPKNEYLMIDTGKSGYDGGMSQAEIFITKYLKNKGVKNIKALIITHFDNDHCGGAVDILESMKVDKVYVNSLTHSAVTAKKIYDKSKEKGSEIILAQNSEVIYKDGDLVITNYLSSNTDNDNDSSIVTFLKYKDFTMLFTGDIGVDALTKIAEELPKNITVLKVPHHGAKNSLSKDVLAILNPAYSIISVGENKFGHPNLYTLALLDGIKTLRTDIHNSVKFVVSKKKLKVFNYDILKKKYVMYN